MHRTCCWCVHTPVSWFVSSIVAVDIRELSKLMVQRNSTPSTHIIDEQRRHCAMRCTLCYWKMNRHNAGNAARQHPTRARYAHALAAYYKAPYRKGACALAAQPHAPTAALLLTSTNVSGSVDQALGMVPAEPHSCWLHQARLT